jgi:tRNA(Leu) C34 or U34 (ribose-2'-O)-methylase TrmL
VGVHGVIYPTRRAAPLSPAAIKAAAGATEHLLLAAVEDLPGNLADLHSRGLRVVAAEENAALTYADADLRGGLALVVGSEGRGISAPVRRRLDLSVRIPMRGKIGSLNAAVAGSIVLFAVAAQRPAPAGAVKDADPSTAEPSTAEASTEVPPTAEPSETSDTQPEPPAKPKRARRTKPAAAPPAEPPAVETEPSELLPGDN